MGALRLLPLLAGGLAAYAAVALWVRVQQRRLIYHPRPAADPSGRLALMVNGTRVMVSHRPHPGPCALIYFGGNAEDVSVTRAELAALLPDTALYLLHYRGYGGSDGSPNERSLRADAEALHALVARRHPSVIVVGRSLGTGPAVHVAASRPVVQLVLLVPFDSLLAVARRALAWLPVDLLLQDRWDAAAEAPQVRAPTRIVAAERDAVVPPEHAVALHRAFREGLAEMVVDPEIAHTTPISLSRSMREALLRAASSACPASPRTQPR
ncbi:hypothetical protein EVJ50_04535 [Synechococcus sp. RSCCF101]|uniref:alpha/beta hydrolase n=1 Tax=Synechococcus sp. RSCCF101 TaxID=2511069 RepID=UPI0012457EEB|nr:alpha/beta hydrolase [Synechococcus sp. RSCCF101]QEY31628.1 hypothetical protein EVJ50_04535 [Synechococcus sp. RSCCF101]